GLFAAPRDAGHAAPVPNGAAGGLETLRTANGLLALRGAMVPTHVFPPGADSDHEPHLKADAAGFVESGFGCQRDVDAQVAAIDPAATIIALPDALLGQKLAGGGPDPGAIAAQLASSGANALVAGAFRPRKAA